MEYLGGQNLDIYLTRKTLSIDTLRAYTAEILEALDYLHSKAVVHKNLRVSICGNVQCYLHFPAQSGDLRSFRGIKPENLVRKGENADKLYFLLFPQGFFFFSLL